MQFKTDGVSWNKAKTTTIPSCIYSSVTDGIQPLFFCGFCTVVENLTCDWLINIQTLRA